jgi:hypothetical protein
MYKKKHGDRGKSIFTLGLLLCVDLDILNFVKCDITEKKTNFVRDLLFQL